MDEMLDKIDPKLYHKFLVIEKGSKVLYTDIQKLLYGILKASLLFWEQVSQELMNLGFDIDPYEWCVDNNMIVDKQFTIGWHVNHFMTTHLEPHENS